MTPIKRTLPKPAITIEAGRVFNHAFDDMYFNQESLEETKHVFIDATDISKRFAYYDVHHVLETGFGTGLNFLSTWDVFRKTAPPHVRLRYAAIEGYPMSSQQISEVSDFFGPLKKLADHMLLLMPPRWPGVHHCWFDHGRVELILMYGEFEDMLNAHEYCADTVYLDGFAPSKNPDMWTPKGLDAIASCMRNGARLATFTAAGLVRRQLSQSGLHVEKVPGFGTKREMIVARKGGTVSHHIERSAISVCGGGIGGVSVARYLQRLGASAIIYEPNGQLGQGASGNPIANQLPRLGLDNTPAHRFAQSAFAFSRREAFATGSELGANGIHLSMNNDQDARFRNIAAQSWPTNYLEYLDAQELSDLLGFSHEFGGLRHEWAGSVDVRDWLYALSLGVEIRAGAPRNGDPCVLAVGKDVTKLLQKCYLPLSVTGGQISQVRHLPKNKSFNMSLSYGGYFTPSRDGLHVFGATFEHDRTPDNTKVTIDGHESNIATMPVGLRHHIGTPDPISCGGRVSFRVSTRDRLPALGKLHDSTYILTGLGARGMTYGPYAGYILACQILGVPSYARKDVLSVLDWNRFAARDRHKL